MSQPKPPWLPARPPTPPQFCGRCPKPPAPPGGQEPPPPRTEWHCTNQQCLWVVCTTCRGVTDVTGLTPGRGAQ